MMGKKKAVPPGMKRCPGPCRMIKWATSEHFARISPETGDFIGACRVCHKARQKLRRSRPEVRERNNARARARRQRPGVAERDRERRAAWLATPAGRDLIRDYNRSARHRLSNSRYRFNRQLRAGVTPEREAEIREWLAIVEEMWRELDEKDEVA